MITWIYPYGPRDENNVRIPYDDKEYIRPFIHAKMAMNDNAYYGRYAFKEIQDLRMKQARKMGIVD